MDILEKLFNGEINLGETYYCDSKSYAVAVEELEEVRKRITSNLTDEQSTLLEDYDDCLRTMATEEAKMYFKIGFCLALQFQEDVTLIRNKYFKEE